MSMMQKRPRPLSASLLAPKGAARPAQPLDQSVDAGAMQAPIAGGYAEGYGDSRTLFDVPPAPKPVPKFGKKQTLPQYPETPEPITQDMAEPLEPLSPSSESHVPIPDASASETSVPETSSQDFSAQEPAADELIEMPKTAGLKKAAFTFRMCEKRHFRLRLLSAHQNRSSQKILEAALDDYLETHSPQTAGMACHCFEGAGSS